jgi:hypothetical protein
VKKKTKARIKAQPKPATVTVTLSSNDFGQMMDGLRERQTAWRSPEDRGSLPEADRRSGRAAEMARRLRYLDAILHFAEWLATAETLPTTAELEAKAWGALLAARN